MRFKSNTLHGYTVYAVAGTDIVSFGIDFSTADTNGLLGFAVERHDKTANEKYFMKGFKVFEEKNKEPVTNAVVSTADYPVQSFVWDDFTAKPEHEYEYFFYPAKGKPKFLQKDTPVSIVVKTEPLYSNDEHDVFFNRGVASSQEYARRFGNQSPDAIEDPALKAAAFAWLTRKLKEALYKFIDQAKKGDSLFGCFYEFHYAETVQKLKDAIDRGVDVRLIVDCKDNEHTETNKKTGEEKTVPAFPKEANLKTIEAIGIPAENIIQRTARKSCISHNKFIIFQPKGANKAKEVWTGSTNISEGGIYGQTNVGHWVKNENTATSYKAYWDLLAEDPGAKEDAVHKVKENNEFKQKVAAIQADLTPEEIDNDQASVIPVFSPRPTLEMLDTYFDLVDTTKESAFITLAFGVSNTLKSKLLQHNHNSPVIFMMLEKKDQANSKAKDKDAFVALNYKNNVYEAYGSYIKDKLNKWTKETTTAAMGLNTHVMYIHTKFLLRDPLGANPVIVTGSANFSDASTKDNDENMLIIKNNLRAADIYFTEFNRLFNHYYFRSVLLDLKAQGHDNDQSRMYLSPDDTWLKNYKPGSLRRKRVDMFVRMSGV